MDCIKLESVSKSIRGKKVIDDISLTIAAGSITTLEGINGSGKTMILKAILGLITTTGDIFINGEKITINAKLPVKAGILIENPSILNNLTAFQNLNLLAKLQDNVTPEDIRALLTRLELGDVIDNKVKDFSLGMKQKLGIAQAFLGNHPLIVLDEPTNALDAESIDRLIEMIKEMSQRGTTVLIASHDKYFLDMVSQQRIEVMRGTIREKQLN